MDYQSILGFLAILSNIIMAVIGWWVKSIQSTQKSMQDAQKEIINDVRKLEVKLPEEYAKKDDLNTRFDKIDATLERLFDKLESKVDK